MSGAEGNGEREMMSWVKSRQDGIGLQGLEKELGFYSQCSRKPGRAAGSGLQGRILALRPLWCGMAGGL